MAICLPGIASRVKRRPTSAIRLAPLVITMKLITVRDDEHHQPDRRVAADEEVAERLDDLARPHRGRVPPSSSTTRVDATLSDRRSRW